MTARTRKRRRTFLAQGKFVVGVVIVGIILLFVVVAPLLDPTSPTALGPDVLAPPSSSHWLGTTQTGEDVFAQLANGGQVSLMVGALSGLIATVFAVLVGVISGYTGKAVDAVLSTVTMIFLVIPGLPLLIVIAGYLPSKGMAAIAVVIAITSWAVGARSIRAQTLSLRSADYVVAARASGEVTWRILVREIVVNEITLIATTFLFTVIAGVLTEAGLSFLGLSSLTTVSWGTMLYFAQNQQALLLGAWWWFVPPGLCIALFGTGLALVNFGLDEWANPRLRRAAASERMPIEPIGPVQEPDAAAVSGSGLMPASAVVTVRGLSVAYGERQAVREASLTIHRGEILGLAGESGSGKSTLTNAIARVLRPPGRVVAGSVTYHGSDGAVDMVRMPEDRLRHIRWSKISMVFQSAMSSLNPVMRIGPQFDDVLRVHRPRLGRRDREALIRRALERVSLDGGVASRYPHELSGGMRQRAAIALALLLSPDLVIMDEPTTALDVLVQRQILDQLLTLQRQDDFAVIFTTHDLALLLELCDTIAVMRYGEVVDYGPVGRIRSDPSHPYTRELLGAIPDARLESAG
jgi:ABC-type dipeptide/oligopeptide/nickel transport system ATPase component/ABC-type dipeptide/oligopeptide/nickel transport system permease subunit